MPHKINVLEIQLLKTVYNSKRYEKDQSGRIIIVTYMYVCKV
jgi:hypothetical protein